MRIETAKGGSAKWGRKQGRPICCAAPCSRAGRRGEGLGLQVWWRVLEFRSSLYRLVRIPCQQRV